MKKINLNSVDQMLCLWIMDQEKIVPNLSAWEFMVLLSSEPLTTATDDLIVRLEEYFVAIEHYDYAVVCRDERLLRDNIQ